jgi:DNA repair protein RadD
VVGLTGTPYRGKGVSIVGTEQFFKEEVCNIGTSWLIENGYLTKPVFGLIECDSYDFSNVRTNSMGKFSGSELQGVIDSSERLTGELMRNLVGIMKSRKGAFIFCCTKKHCEEAARSLPSEETRIITAETSHEERKKILEQAKKLRIKYLVNVNVLLTGVDVPVYDVCVFLRPTESLVLFTQAIGRILRLHESKYSALVLDYAGNFDRHGDIDDPIINEAIKPRKENEKEYIIPCFSCDTKNTIHSRRCIGVDTDTNSRCSHYFVWKDCHGCSKPNDVTARRCAHCDCELIDPNAKLTANPNKQERVILDVSEARFWVSDNNGVPCFCAMYKLRNGKVVYESYVVRDTRTANIFYGQFLKKAIDKPSEFYTRLSSVDGLRSMTASGRIKCPIQVHCTIDQGVYTIKKKVYGYEGISSSN